MGAYFGAVFPLHDGLAKSSGRAEIRPVHKALHQMLWRQGLPLHLHWIIGIVNTY